MYVLIIFNGATVYLGKNLGAYPGFLCLPQPTFQLVTVPLYVIPGKLSFSVDLPILIPMLFQTLMTSHCICLPE